MKTQWIKAALVIACMSSGVAFGQNLPFWSNQGNSNATATDFLGTTNNTPLIFKTNGLERGRFEANGNFLLTGNITANKLYIARIVSTDSILRFGDSTIYMDNNYNRISWSDAGTIKGLAIGNLRPTGNGLNSIAIGTGVSTGASADNSIIIGSVATGQQFSNNTANSLMVGFNSTIPTMYVGPSSGANTVGNVGIGTASPTANFEVAGTSKMNGVLTLGSNLHFGNNYGIEYVPATANTPQFLVFGQLTGDIPGPSDPPSIPPCFGAVTTVNAFNGMIQSWGNAANGGQQNVMTMGYDGGNGIIDIEGSNDDGFSPRLLLNYYCGKDILMCTGPNGGVVTVGRNLEVGNVTRDMALALNVKGATKISVDNSTTNALEVVDATSQATNFLVKTNGNVYARRMEVTLNNFPDYVFEKDYKLLTLEEVSQYIKENKHLPGMPTAKTVESNGADLGELSRLNVEKIEELYLHLISVNERLKKLEEENSELKRQLEQK